MANFVTEQVDSKAEVVIDQGRRWLHNSVHSNRHAKIQGIDHGRVKVNRRKSKGRLPLFQTDEAARSASEPLYSR